MQVEHVSTRGSWGATVLASKIQVALAADLALRVLSRPTAVFMCKLDLNVAPARTVFLSCVLAAG